METLSDRASIRETLFVASIVCLCPLDLARAVDLQVREIRFASIGSYDDKLFTLKIRSDRTVEYLGKNFVDVTGRRRSRNSMVTL
jgi:hypothetical protein